MDERVYITLSHLISLRTGGKVGSEKGKRRMRVTAKISGLPSIQIPLWSLTQLLYQLIPCSEHSVRDVKEVKLVYKTEYIIQGQSNAQCGQTSCRWGADSMIMSPWFTAAPLFCLTRTLLCTAEGWDGGETPPTHIQRWDMCSHTALFNHIMLE